MNNSKSDRLPETKRIAGEMAGGTKDEDVGLRDDVDVVSGMVVHQLK
jgi:hypothetical protein